MYLSGCNCIPQICCTLHILIVLTYLEVNLTLWVAEVECEESGVTPGSGNMEWSVLYPVSNVHISTFVQKKFGHLIAVATQVITITCTQA